MQTLSTPTPRTSIRAGATLAVVALVTLAGCSSDSSKPKSSDTLPEASSSTTASSTTATSAPSTEPECTVVAAGAVLAPDTATSILCGEGWASGSMTNEEFDSAYLLRAENGVWAKADVAEACPAEGGVATNPLGIPQNVFDASPCKVS